MKQFCFVNLLKKKTAIFSIELHLAMKNYLFLIALFVFLKVSAQCVPPSPMLSISKNRFCESEGPLQLSVENVEELGVNYTYRWYVDYPNDLLGEQLIQGSKAPVAVAQSATYRVEVVSDNCSQTGSASLQVTVDKMPVVDAGPLIVIHTNQTFFINGFAVDYETLQWSPEYFTGGDLNESSTSFFSGNKDTSITMTLTAINGECISQDQTTITVRSLLEELEVRPSIITDESTIIVDKRGTIQIINMEGVVFFTEFIDPGAFRVRLSYLKTGTYILRFIGEDGSSQEKRIVKF